MWQNEYPHLLQSSYAIQYKHSFCRSAFELWGHGQTQDELRLSLLNFSSERMVGDTVAQTCLLTATLKNCDDTTLWSADTEAEKRLFTRFFLFALFLLTLLQSPFMRADSTYRINVYTFNKTLEFADRINKIDVSICIWYEWVKIIVKSRFLLSLQALEYLPFKGTVSLKSPQHIFCLLEDYGTDPNDIPEHPYHIYFGRWVRGVWLKAKVVHWSVMKWLLNVNVHKQCELCWLVRQGFIHFFTWYLVLVMLYSISNIFELKRDTKYFSFYQIGIFVIIWHHRRHNWDIHQQEKEQYVFDKFTFFWSCSIYEQFTCQ